MYMGVSQLSPTRLSWGERRNSIVLKENKPLLKLFGGCIFFFYHCIKVQLLVLHCICIHFYGIKRTFTTCYYILWHSLYCISAIKPSILGRRRSPTATIGYLYHQHSDGDLKERAAAYIQKSLWSVVPRTCTLP